MVSVSLDRKMSWFKWNIYNAAPECCYSVQVLFTEYFEIVLIQLNVFIVVLETYLVKYVNTYYVFNF